VTGSSVVRARIDERTKREASAALKRIGLTVSDAFRLLLVRVAAEKALPFEPLNPNAETVAAMKAARRGELTQLCNSRPERHLSPEESVEAMERSSPQNRAAGQPPQRLRWQDLR